MRASPASLAGVLLASLLSASVPAQPPPAGASRGAAEAGSAAAAPTAAPAVPKAAPAAAPAPKAAPDKTKDKTPPPAPLPEPQVRLWIVAPSPDGPWAFRLDNEGSRPVRIPADIRLLHFEINNESFVIDTAPDGPKKPAKAQKPQKPKKPIVCGLPAPLRPDGFPDKNALLLAPGETYIESFDPRLFCFGKDASPALVGAAEVRSWFGWEAPKKRGKKGPEGPFAVESTDFPATLSPLRSISAPTIVLSFAKPKPEPTPRTPGVAQVAVDPTKPGDPPKPLDAAKPPDTKGPDATKDTKDTKDLKDAKDTKSDDIDDDDPLTRPPIVDENAPRLELSATPYLDVSAPDRATITITATNAGHRPMLAAIRPRMLGFRIHGPGGAVQCDAAGPTHAVPREGFSTIKPGASMSMTILLAEVCPREALRRPGLYRVKPTLYLGESGAELGLSAYTGTVSVKTPTLLRLLAGPEPFYATTPKAMPIPKPRPSPDAERDTPVAAPPK